MSNKYLNLSKTQLKPLNLNQMKTYKTYGQLKIRFHNQNQIETNIVKTKMVLDTKWQESQPMKFRNLQACDNICIAQIANKVLNVQNMKQFDQIYHTLITNVFLKQLMKMKKKVNIDVIIAKED